ncbi:hypothetical protein DCAR_0414565 [Daucus carota subsp. sativus]|uniref:Uncharacterized protein n=1 Tax=Daucus carota subsp. sativus TaxID=79200 RepID=A0A175YCC2_DAUCS|nr:hypothetical protein DCAR_0414565 [Daucus carota subsp. sativus]
MSSFYSRLRLRSKYSRGASAPAPGGVKIPRALRIKSPSSPKSSPSSSVLGLGLGLGGGGGGQHYSFPSWPRHLSSSFKIELDNSSSGRPSSLNIELDNCSASFIKCETSFDSESGKASFRVEANICKENKL